jgi:hypothetical protein
LLLSSVEQSSFVHLTLPASSFQFFSTDYQHNADTY